MQSLDMEASLRRLSKDPHFKALAARFPKPELVYSRNAFRSLAESIIYQQLAGSAAASICKKFVALYAPKRFPAPADVLRTPLPKLRSAGLSSAKAAALIDLAQKLSDKHILPKRFSAMSDEGIREHVTQVRGVGPWTADMFLIFALNRPNVLPVGDLGIQKGAQLFFKLTLLPSQEELRHLARGYDGDHTVFSLYLWKLADSAKSVKKK